MTDIVERLRTMPAPLVAHNIGENYQLAMGLCREAADEIERLREALRHYVSECDCNGGTYYEEDHITGKTLVKDCPKCEQARAALGEKE